MAIYTSHSSGRENKLSIVFYYLLQCDVTKCIEKNNNPSLYPLGYINVKNVW